MSRFAAPLFAALLVAAGPVRAAATATATAAAEPDRAETLRSAYTKYEYRIRMRDGARLFTAVYVPKDAAPTPFRAGAAPRPGEGARYPILMTRTPYSCAPYGPDRYPKAIGPSKGFEDERFVFVCQDVRGRFQSEGTWEEVRPILDAKGPKDADESTDAWDTVDWLVKNVPGTNGRAGIWGISYPGFYAACAAVDAHPALVAVSPQAPIADWFEGDDFHRNGAFWLPHAFNFYSVFGKLPAGAKKWPERFDPGTHDGYRYFLSIPPLSEVNAKLWEGKVAFWDEVVKHDTDDSFWKARDLRPHLKAVHTSVLTVGGWFDAEDLFGALSVYRSIERTSPGAWNALVMGPWSHGGWGRSEGDRLGIATFGDKTAPWFREKVELPFFVSLLKDGAAPKLPEATVFETGTNVWRRLDRWPPANAVARSLYLGARGALTWEKPAETGDAFDEWVSDPGRPVPFIDWIDIGMPKEYMTADQRFASRRPDVMVYETPVLEDDVTLAGPLKAHLEVSTTGTDSDFVVKLIDVWPDDLPTPDPNPSGFVPGGAQQMVRGNVIRGKFRRSLEKPEPFTPGKPDVVDLSLPDVFHTFRSGHRIMVQVQSSWFPLVDRNPQQFMNVFEAKPGDYRKATQRLYHDASHASRLEVLVVPQGR